MGSTAVRLAAAQTVGRLPVLVVDDNAAVLRMTSRMLEAGGWDVTAVQTPEAALHEVETRRYMAVLADYEMPGMNGTDFLRRVRQQAPELVRVLITANPDAAVAIDAVNRGHIFRFLAKPWTRETLLSTLDDATHEYELATAQSVARTAQANRRSLREELERALSCIWMAYQPIISWSEQRIVAREALLRSSDIKLSNPGLILDAAEQLEAVPLVGRRVRQEVAGQLARDPEMQAFVNLHAAELLDEDLYDPSAPLSRVAGRVVLEITERVALSAIDDTAERMQRLRTMGFRIAVDDLGAGYAGLTSLVQLTPEVIKLDMSLVRDLHQSPTKQKLVRALVVLGKELGSLVIAEGVETEAERDTLISLGCDLFQGYLFGKPARIA